MLLQQRYELSEDTSHWDIWLKGLIGRIACAKSLKLYWFWHVQIQKIFIKTGAKRLQKKIIGEEIRGDSLNLLNCICKDRFLLLFRMSVLKRVMVDLTHIVHESLWLTCGEQNDTRDGGVE